MNITFIQSKLADLQTQLADKKKKSYSISMIRLLFIVAVIISIFFAYQQKQILWYVIGTVALIVFLVFVKLHVKLDQEINDIETRIEAYDDLIKRKNREWKHFVDQGDDFLEEKNTQAYDLDLFGKASLFQYINVAATWEGRQSLAQLLSWEKQDSLHIKARQDAVKECSVQVETSMNMVSLSKQYRRHVKKKQQKKLHNLYEYMEKEEKGYSLVLQLLSFGLPIVVWVAILFMIILNMNYGIMLVSFMASIVISLVCAMKTGEILSPVDGIADVMKDYERILMELQRSQWQSVYLLEIQNDTSDALEGIRSLNRILSIVRMRGNFIFLIFLNGLFMSDIHSVNALIKWKKRYGHRVKGWLKAVGRMEAVLSLLQIAYAKDVIVYPTIQQGTSPYLKMELGHHPLIIEGEAIANSFEANSSSYIITGSNMSGKTTFLRTIGVNMVLFQAGAPVCAKVFDASSMHIFTSMRVHDDVSEGISTFYAEILRIKEMMQFTKQKEFMIVLIDEIFKGTNSADRILCAKQAIIQLHLPWVITMISTHDFELCDLEYDEHIKAINYHFREYYENDKICFDYRMKDGRCKTTNAKQLMKLAGFWEDV